MMKKYKCNLTAAELRKAGFFYAGSYDGAICYEYNFPCLWYRHRVPVLSARVTVILPDGEVNVTVNNGGLLYPPYIRKDNAYTELNRQVDYNINKELDKIGFIEIKERKGRNDNGKSSKV